MCFGLPFLANRKQITELLEETRRMQEQWVDVLDAINENMQLNDFLLISNARF